MKKILNLNKSLLLGNLFKSPIKKTIDICDLPKNLLITNIGYVEINALWFEKIRISLFSSKEVVFYRCKIRKQNGIFKTWPILCSTLF